MCALKQESSTCSVSLLLLLCKTTTLLRQLQVLGVGMLIVTIIVNLCMFAFSHKLLWPAARVGFPHTRFLWWNAHRLLPAQSRGLLCCLLASSNTSRTEEPQGSCCERKPFLEAKAMPCVCCDK